MKPQPLFGMFADPALDNVSDHLRGGRNVDAAVGIARQCQRTFGGDAEAVDPAAGSRARRRLGSQTAVPGERWLGWPCSGGRRRSRRRRARNAGRPACRDARRASSAAAISNAACGAAADQASHQGRADLQRFPLPPPCCSACDRPRRRAGRAWRPATAGSSQLARCAAKHNAGLPSSLQLGRTSRVVGDDAAGVRPCRGRSPRMR